MDNILISRGENVENRRVVTLSVRWCAFCNSFSSAGLHSVTHLTCFPSLYDRASGVDRLMSGLRQWHRFLASRVSLIVVPGVACCLALVFVTIGHVYTACQKFYKYGLASTFYVRVKSFLQVRTDINFLLFQ